MLCDFFFFLKLLNKLCYVCLLSAYAIGFGWDIPPATITGTRVTNLLFFGCKFELALTSSC